MRVRAAVTAAALLPILTTAPALAVANGSDVPAGQFRFTAKLAMANIPRPTAARIRATAPAR